MSWTDVFSGPGLPVISAAGSRAFGLQLGPPALPRLQLTAGTSEPPQHVSQFLYSSHRCLPMPMGAASLGGPDYHLHAPSGLTKVMRCFPLRARGAWGESSKEWQDMAGASQGTWPMLGQACHLLFQNTGRNVSSCRGFHSVGIAKLEWNSPSKPTPRHRARPAETHLPPAGCHVWPHHRRGGSCSVPGPGWLWAP